MEISPEQESTLSAIAQQLDLLESNKQRIEHLLNTLPDPHWLIDIKLPPEDQVAEHLVDHCLAPLQAPLMQLQEAAALVSELSEHVNDEIDTLEEGIASLSTLPTAIEDAYKNAQQKLEEAVDELQTTITDQLVPTWQQLKQNFQDLGADSLTTFKSTSEAYLQDFDEKIVERVKITVERKFAAIQQIQQATESLKNNSTSLATNIQTICNTLADAQHILNQQTSRANSGVEMTITTIKDINESIRRILGGYL